MSAARSPTLAQVIRRAIDARLADLRVALPAKIEKFDPSTQLASVKPLLRESHEDEDGTEAVESLPVISDVPVQFPGSGGFVLTFPVQAGDPCWLVFADRSLDKWIASGGEVDPVDLRRHHLSDAVAVLGVRSKAAALSEFDAGNARVGKVGGPGVTFKAAEVHLGVSHDESATEAALRGTTFRQKQAALHADLVSVFGTLQGALTAFLAAMTPATKALLLPPAGVAVNAAVAAFVGTASGACATAITKINAFETEAAAAQNHLSTIVKVK